MAIKVFPYNMGSQGAKALARELGALQVRANGRYQPRVGDLIVNWGNSTIPQWMPTVQRLHIPMLNAPQAVNLAQNKLTTLTRLRAEGVNVPPFITSRREAESWLRQGSRVYCRTLLRASEGRGIVCATLKMSDPDYQHVNHELVDAPLYVLGINGIRTEYRVHVFQGQALSMSRKRALTPESLEERGILRQGSFVRNLANGYIYSRESAADIQSNPALADIAVRAVQALGLDFGAVDLIAKMRKNEVWVLEVNTAPGIEGETLTAYASAIRFLIGE